MEGKPSVTANTCHPVCGRPRRPSCPNGVAGAITLNGAPMTEMPPPVSRLNAGPTIRSTTRNEKESRLKSPDIRVGFILSPSFTLLPFAGFVDTLRHAADEGDRSRQVHCRWTILGATLDPVRASCGAEIRPWQTYGDPGAFDYVVIVGGLTPAFRDHVPGDLRLPPIGLRAERSRGRPVHGVVRHGRGRPSGRQTMRGALPAPGRVHGSLP